MGEDFSQTQSFERAQQKKYQLLFCGFSSRIIINENVINFLNLEF